MIPFQISWPAYETSKIRKKAIVAAFTKKNGHISAILNSSASVQIGR